MGDFVHLHLHTEYSLLDGAARIKKLVKIAKEYNMPAVAITDHGNMYGAIKFNDACKKEGIKPIFGCEFYCCDDLTVKNGKTKLNHLILLVKDEVGYHNICKLNAIAFRDGFYYKPRIDKQTLAKYHEGLVCTSACLAGEIPSLIMEGRYDEAEKLILWFKDLFKDDFYLEIQGNGIQEQYFVNEKLHEYSKKFDIKLVATNDVHYLYKEDAELQDILMCVNMQKSVDDPDRMRMGSNEFYFKTYEQMKESLPNDEEAINNTIEIANKCNFEFTTLDKHMYLFPRYVPEDGSTPKEYIMKLIDQGIQKKYGGWTKELHDRIDSEMAVIEKQGFIEYFLIVWDYINAARNMGISVGPGRGSGAGSLVAYTIGITNIDPIKFQLFFERFLHSERVSAPDFDVDFEDSRRGEVIDYVRRKYGEDKVVHIITFGTMAAKNAIKDVGRVMRVPLSKTDAITKLIPNGKPPILPKCFGFDEKASADQVVNELVDMYNNDEDVKKIVDIAIKLEGFPRQCSTHACGVIIGQDTIEKFVPIGRNGEDITTQFEGVDMERLGLLKMDFLGLRNLSDIKGCVDLVEKNHGIKVDFSKSNYDDPNVFKLISSGDTKGIFQIESAGFQKFMKELQPTCIEDIVAAVSLYRPGPMDSIPTYVHYKHHPEETKYAHPILEPILNVTYGCMVYQEQVMKACQALAGFTLGQADMVRRAMGKKHLDEMQQMRGDFIYGREAYTDSKGKFHTAIDGALKRGVPEDVANKIWTEMEGFASYAFNKSHAAAYSLITYQTAYLKTYYLPEFITALLNNRITFIDKIKSLVAYAKESKVAVIPPDINKSEIYFSTDGKSIRFGIAALKNVGVNVVESIIKERNENGPFKDLVDFTSRVDGQALNKRCVESLIKSGAFDCFGKTRSQLMGVYTIAIDRALEAKRKSASGQIDMFGGILKNDDVINDLVYPNEAEFIPKIKLQMEKEIAGIYLSGHPLEDFTEKMKTFTLNSSMLQYDEEDDMENLVQEETNKVAGFSNGDIVSCGGVLTDIKTRLSKSGERMAMGGLEDMTGTIGIVVFPRTYEKYRDIIADDNLVEIKGKLSIRGGMTPSVSVLSIKIMEKEKDEHEQVSEKVEQKRLCLIFNIGDLALKNTIMKLLEQYPGTSDVYVKDELTGKKYKLNMQVEPRQSLIYELETIIDKSKIILL